MYPFLRIRPPTPSPPLRRVPPFPARGSWVLALPVALAAAGCGESASAPGPETAVRDSAGVRVVETRVPTADAASELEAEGWSLGPNEDPAGADGPAGPRVVLGDEPAEPGGELFRVGAAGRLSGGGWAVANGGSREVFLYDEEGAHLRTVGGSGDGPGEFTSLGGIAVLPGDTLLAWNLFPDRMTLLDPTGELVRTFTLPPTDDRTRTNRVTARLSDGTWVGSTTTSPQLEPGPVNHALRIFGADDPAEEPRMLAELPGFRGHLAAVEGVIVNVQVPFTATGTWAVHDDRIFAGNGERWEVWVLDGEGRHEALIRLDHPRRPVTAADRARAREAELERFGDPPPQELADALDGMEVPGTMAAWDELRVDALGHLWLRAYLPPWEAEEAGSRTWWVFAPDGGALGTLRLPADLTVYAIEADGVLGLRRDDLDVERVEFLPLERGG